MPSAGSTIPTLVTLSTSTWRRTRRNAWSVPSRRFTSRSSVVPSLPWSRLAASSRPRPLIERPPTLTIISPAFMPASHAGPPRITPTRSRPSLLILSSTPRPTKLPSIIAYRSSSLSGVR